MNEIDKDIVRKKEEIHQLNVLKDKAPKDKEITSNPNFIEQSATLENYMDYDFYESGSPNNTFKRKSLTYQQCQLMQNEGSEKGYLKL